MIGKTRRQPPTTTLVVRLRNNPCLHIIIEKIIRNVSNIKSGNNLPLIKPPAGPGLAGLPLQLYELANRTQLKPLTGLIFLGLSPRNFVPVPGGLFRNPQEKAFQKPLWDTRTSCQGKPRGCATRGDSGRFTNLQGFSSGYLKKPP